MDNRLTGKRIALVFVGSVDGDVRSSVEQALTRRGRQRCALPRADGAGRRADARRALASAAVARYVGDDGCGALGRDARRRARAAATRRSGTRSRAQLVEERAAAPRRRRRGRRRPHRAAAAGRRRRSSCAASTRASATGVPAVGVENTDAQPSASRSSSAGLSTVDDVDTPTGRLALALLLAGAPRAYGVKRRRRDGACRSLPPTRRAGG